MQTNKEEVILPLTEYSVEQIREMDVDELQKSVLLTSEEDVRAIFKKVTGKSLPNKTIKRMFQ